MTTLEKREKIRNEEITMTRASYMAKVRRAENMGAINALLKVGKTYPEIAKILELKESYVKSIEEVLGYGNSGE